MATTDNDSPVVTIEAVHHLSRQTSAEFQGHNLDKQSSSSAERPDLRKKASFKPMENESVRTQDGFLSHGQAPGVGEVGLSDTCGFKASNTTESTGYRISSSDNELPDLISPYAEISTESNFKKTKPESGTTLPKKNGVKHKIVTPISKKHIILSRHLRDNASASSPPRSVCNGSVVNQNGSFVDRTTTSIGAESSVSVAEPVNEIDLCPRQPKNVEPIISTFEAERAKVQGPPTAGSPNYAVGDPNGRAVVLIQSAAAKLTEMAHALSSQSGQKFQMEPFGPPIKQPHFQGSIAGGTHNTQCYHNDPRPITVDSKQQNPESAEAVRSSNAYHQGEIQHTLQRDQIRFSERPSAEKTLETSNSISNSGDAQRRKSNKTVKVKWSGKKNAQNSKEKCDNFAERHPEIIHVLNSPDNCHGPSQTTTPTAYDQHGCHFGATGSSTDTQSHAISGIDVIEERKVQSTKQSHYSTTDINSCHRLQIIETSEQRHDQRLQIKYSCHENIHQSTADFVKRQYPGNFIRESFTDAPIPPHVYQYFHAENTHNQETNQIIQRQQVNSHQSNAFRPQNVSPGQNNPEFTVNSRVHEMRIRSNIPTDSTSRHYSASGLCNQQVNNTTQAGESTIATRQVNFVAMADLNDTQVDQARGYGYPDSNIVCRSSEPKNGVVHLRPDREREDEHVNSAQQGDVFLKEKRATESAGADNSPNLIESVNQKLTQIMQQAGFTPQQQNQILQAVECSNQKFNKQINNSPSPTNQSRKRKQNMRTDYSRDRHVHQGECVAILSGHKDDQSSEHLTTAMHSDLQKRKKFHETSTWAEKQFEESVSSVKTTEAFGSICPSQKEKQVDVPTNMNQLQILVNGLDEATRQNIPQENTLHSTKLIQNSQERHGGPKDVLKKARNVDKACGATNAEDKQSVSHCQAPRVITCKRRRRRFSRMRFTRRKQCVNAKANRLQKNKNGAKLSMKGNVTSTKSPEANKDDGLNSRKDGSTEKECVPGSPEQTLDQSNPTNRQHIWLESYTGAQKPHTPTKTVSIEHQNGGQTPNIFENSSFNSEPVYWPTQSKTTAAQPSTSETTDCHQQVVGLSTAGAQPSVIFRAATIGHHHKARGETTIAPSGGVDRENIPTKQDHQFNLGQHEVRGQHYAMPQTVGIKPPNKSMKSHKTRTDLSLVDLLRLPPMSHASFSSTYHERAPSTADSSPKTREMPSGEVAGPEPTLKLATHMNDEGSEERKSRCKTFSNTSISTLGVDSEDTDDLEIIENIQDERIRNLECILDEREKAIAIIRSLHSVR